jgi:hypothetical protein
MTVRRTGTRRRLRWFSVLALTATPFLVAALHAALVWSDEGSGAEVWFPSRLGSGDEISAPAGVLVWGSMYVVGLAVAWALSAGATSPARTSDDAGD